MCNLRTLWKRPTDSGDESSHCDLDCSSTPRTLVCGTDGRTYNSACEASRANCEGHLVKIKHSGECADASRCLVERANAQEVARKPAVGVFIPDCHPDGTYIDVQCHAGTGYCWCVTTQGKPIPGSSARYKRPNCVAYQNANSHKRTSRGKKPRRSCSITDREEFNTNMNKIFESEYNRTQDGRNASLTDSLARRAANWKFSILDVSKNDQLSKSELRDLRRMVKKIIHPRSCARTFTQYCDLDQNKNITRQEWTTCLGVDADDHDNTKWLLRGEHLPDRPHTTTPITPVHEGLRGKQVQSLRQLLSSGTLTTSRRQSTSRDYVPVDQRPPAPISSWKEELKILSSGSLDSGLLAELRPTDSSERRRDPSKKKKPNCVSERTKALAKQGKSLGGGIYVPNCEKSGSYANVQCHSATGYCWCVNPENGKPIPNTSTHNSQPNCNVAAVRPLRGCPAQRKELFVINLATLTVNEMVNSFANSTAAVPGFKPSQDDALRWKFRILDINQNANIERSEWRSFKQYMATDEKLAKCGRGFFKFCDADDNRKVTVDEWLQCVNLSRDSTHFVTGHKKNDQSLPSLHFVDEPRKLPVNMKRKGSNPLTKYLKPD